MKFQKAKKYNTFDGSWWLSSVNKGPIEVGIQVFADIKTADKVATLIEAAPDLLEACEYALQNLRPQGNVKKDFSGHNAVAALSRAIQKAKGQ